ncbi:hypothetical protein [Shewanella marina]|uniref:hypothetical protein n=1 Tax=Shewanella marina TaxID=487319 RepID=UPI000471BA11|nr:hypothetical protein [Shewanella marina]
MERRRFLVSVLAVSSALAVGSYHYLQIDDLDDVDGRDLLLACLIPVLLAGALPEVPSHRQQSINRTIIAIKDAIAVLVPAEQQQIEQLLTLLEQRLGLLILTGSATPLLLRQPQQLNQMLNEWRDSYLDLYQQAYLGLKELFMASFYACPEHWAALDYQLPHIASVTQYKDGK